MSRLEQLEPGAVVPGERATVVVITLHGAHEHFARCLPSVLAHTPTDVPVLVADDAGPDPASRALAERVAAGRPTACSGSASRRTSATSATCNAAFATCGRADVACS